MGTTPATTINFDTTYTLKLPAPALGDFPALGNYLADFSMGVSPESTSSGSDSDAWLSTESASALNWPFDVGVLQTVNGGGLWSTALSDLSFSAGSEWVAGGH